MNSNRDNYGSDVNNDRFAVLISLGVDGKRWLETVDAAINFDEFSREPKTRFRQRHFCRFFHPRLDDEQIIALDV